jgi:hypothetical protein
MSLSVIGAYYPRRVAGSPMFRIALAMTLWTTLSGLGQDRASSSSDDLSHPYPGSQMYVYPRLTMDDGTIPRDPVTIEVVCGIKTTRSIVYADSKGGFSLGQGRTMDASGEGRSLEGKDLLPPTRSGLAPNCKVRASVTGFRSSEVDIAYLMRGDANVVTLVLHPVARIEGQTTSRTSAQAPPTARSAFDKAGRAIYKQRWEEAIKQLRKAVEIYPEYAEAWSDLGNSYAEREQTGEARGAYRRAISIDAKFVNPYLGLAQAAMHERNWQEMAEVTAVILKLNRYDFPAAYAYDAMAHLNLNELNTAEESAREGLKIDNAGDIPKLHHLLGVVLMRKHDFPVAVEHLRQYLQGAPNAPDADFVRRQLAACENQRAF